MSQEKLKTMLMQFFFWGGGGAGGATKCIIGDVEVANPGKPHDSSLNPWI